MPVEIDITISDTRDKFLQMSTICIYPKSSIILLWFPVCLPPLIRDQPVGRHRHLFNFRSHGSYLQKAYWKSGERRSDYDTRCKKRKHFMIILCDILSSLCRVRPCFYCISRGFNPAAHFPFMVHSVFCHAYHHWRGLSVHSDR